MAGLVPVVTALLLGLLPELEAMRKPPLRGEITFPEERPDFHPSQPAAGGGSETPVWSMDWLADRYEDLMAWDENPWKVPRSEFGRHYWDLLGSKDPKDQARARELRRLAEALHRRMLERYPELAVPEKSVPPERNGFLKWLEFGERFDADPKRPGNPKSKSLEMPADVRKRFDGQAEWDAAAVRSWLDQEKDAIDEIRAIGLMPEQSMKGIDIDRWAFISARLAKSCTDALLLDARLAAEEGDVSRAMDSLQAANGIANHLGNIETPSLLGVTVQILVQLSVQKYAFAEVMPRVPAGQLDPAAWEKAVAPTVHPPAEFARIMKGEWNVTAREYLLPMVADTEDPKYPPDPEALLDFHASGFLRVVQHHEGRALTDLPDIPMEFSYPDDGRLSRQSRKVTQFLWVGAAAWRKGWERTVSASAMTQAAFAVLKGESLPKDPVYGQPYRWDPASRTLSAPDTAAFEEMDLKPIVVPKP